MVAMVGPWGVACLFGYGHWMPFVASVSVLFVAFAVGASDFANLEQINSSQGPPLHLTDLAMDGVPILVGCMAVAVALLSCCAIKSAKAFSGQGKGTRTPDGLQVFAVWAQQQIEESSPEAHRKMLDDVVSTFSSYRQRLDSSTTSSDQRHAVLRIRVLIDLLETPEVNRALRAVNWAWLREWDRKLLEPNEARFRCAVVLPTIIAAASVQESDRSSTLAAASSGCSSYGNSNSASWKSHGSLSYLASWCSDFLDRPDVRAFMESSPATDSAYREFGNGPLRGYASSEDEDDMSTAASPPKGKQESQPKGNEFVKRSCDDQEHCWDHADASQMKVRGANYLTDGLKVNSQPSMLELACVDLFKSSEEVVHYTKWHDSKIPSIRREGDSRFLFVINFRLPPIHFSITWAVPREDDWQDGPEGTLFRRFLEMTDAQRHERLKVLCKVTDGPWLVQKGVPDRPGVVGRKLAIEYFQQDNLLEVSLNCISSPAGRRVVQLLTGAAKIFAMEVYVILEGQQPDELPERILGGIAVFYGDLPSLPVKG